MQEQSILESTHGTQIFHSLVLDEYYLGCIRGDIDQVIGGPTRLSYDKM